MHIPLIPPKLEDLFLEIQSAEKLISLVSLADNLPKPTEYIHWDKLRHLPSPPNLTHREWWLMLKLSRKNSLKQIPLNDIQNKPFSFSLTDKILKELHQIDLGAGGSINTPDPITNPHTRDRYLVNSLIQEALTSSQLEGAVTTRNIAKEMIRSGRPPRDLSEQMVLNNYKTMMEIQKLKDQPLTPNLVLQIHHLVTEDTLNPPDASGRLRLSHEKCVVGDDYNTIYHTPPLADELHKRMADMCAFANAQTPDYFIHPAVRAIILHFWLAYDHPFVDGNGRTARALFYWCMLRNKYWLFEFISISSALRKAPTKYARSFLYTETDDNDLTYFLIAQTKAIRGAIMELHEYIALKTNELNNAEANMRALDLFNHRQVEVIRHALKHPGQVYTFASHKRSHGIAYQTARTDLLDLSNYNLLTKQKRHRRQGFVAPSNLSDRLIRLEKQQIP